MAESIKESPPHRTESCWRFMEQFLRNLGEERGVWWGAEAKGKEGEKEKGTKKATLRFNFGPTIN